jgi:hypothetical protein
VVVTVANAQRPTQKLDRVKRAIEGCKERLEGKINLRQKPC